MGVMPDRSYWVRVLTRFTGAVAVTFLDKQGNERLYRGRVLRTDDDGGPIVDVRGEAVRLCAWERLRSVEVSGGD